MKLLDLFSGIGGFSLGAEYNNIKTVGFVEKDAYCQKVLQKHWPDVPILGDIRDVKRDTFESVDIVSGGFPCQPFSVAGKQRGTDDDRYLWDETIRVVSLYKPRWFVGENVEGLVNIQNGVVLRQVQDDLEKEGFEVQCGIIPASGIGAWHQRKRVWIIAYSNSNRESRRSQYVQQGSRELGESHVCDSQHNGSFTTKEQRGNTQTSTGSQKRENSSLQSERTSRPTDNGDVSHTNNDGLKRGQSETCNEDASGKNDTSFRGESASNTSRSDDDRGNKKETRIDEGVSRSHDGNQKESSTRKGLCDLSEKSDKCSAVGKTSADQENNDRTLVQKRQVFQLSNSRGLGDDQALSERDQVRSRNDNTVSHRVDTKNVSNTIGELSDGCGSATRFSESKQEWMDSHSQEYKDKVWRKTERCDQQAQSRGDVSDTDGKGLQGHRVQANMEVEEGQVSSISSSQGQRTWWETESRVRGIPHGISYGMDKGRVNRIKSLGNSIVPQIAYQIFKSIIVAEEEK